MKVLALLFLAASSAWGQSASAGAWTMNGAEGPGGAVMPPPSLASITIAPGGPAQTIGSAVAFTATGTYSDGSTQNVTATATWASGNAAVASLGALSTTESVNCLAAGTSVISATLGLVVGTTTLTCKAPVTLSSIAVTPATPTQVNGATVTFTATGTYSDGSTQNLTATSNWSSSNPSVGSLGAWGNPSLVVTCAGVGTSSIQATNSSLSGRTTLTCTAATSATSENAYCTSNNDASCFATAQTDGPASLPQAGVYTGADGTPANGTVVTVSCGSNCTTAVQTALNSAVCGQRVVIPAINNGSQNVIGAITLPAHSCDAGHWIWVEGDQTGAAGFPAEHTRATPCAINQASVVNYPSYPCSTPATLMPAIQCSTGSACVTVAAGSNFYRLIGLEIHAAPAGTNNVASAVDLSGGADHIIFDRDIVHGVPVNCTQANGVYTCASGDVAHGILAANSTNVAVINSWIYDILCPQASCVDATGVGLGGNGAVSESVKKLFNNFIASASGAYFAGGGGQGVGSTTLTPTDFEIRGNHFFKPVTWALCNGCSGQHPEFKNDGELKNANRALIEGNVYENSWAGWQTDQAGFLTLLTPKNQSSKSFGTASSDGAGNLTAIGSTFPSNVTSSSCATPGHCTIQYNAGTYSCQAQIYTDPTHISVGSCTPSLPPVTASASFTACSPGLNPTAHAPNITMRFNDFRNGKNGIQFAAGTSDCGDVSAGISAVSIHDNLFQGINTLLSNAKSPGTGQECLEIANGQAAPDNIYNFLFEHNTCATAVYGYPYSFAGLDFALDSTDTAGNGGTYMSNRVERNNLGVAGGLAGYNQGALYSGGLNRAISLQSCTPPGGTTCSWTYTKNVEGIGLWNHQSDGRPYPASNADAGDSPAGTGCSASGATCHPSGSAFTSLFVNYNGPNGQSGYLGNYQLAGGSPYAGAGTDGKDIGISDWTKFNNLTSGVRSSTTYTAASILTSSLPNAVISAAYSQQLAATSASDFQAWQVISGSLPAGLSLSLAGVISGTPTTSGSSTFTVQMMDAAQQYATQALTLVVTTGNPSGSANWQLVSTPASATQIDGFAVDASNNWYISDRQTGLWKSANQGSSWTQINSGIPTPCGSHIQVDPHGQVLIANAAPNNCSQTGNSHFYRSTNQGASWTQIPEPTGFAIQNDSQTASLMPPASGGTLLMGGAGASGGSSMYSLDDGVTTALTSTNPLVGTVRGWGTGAGSLLEQGTENGGLYQSSNGGATFTQIWPWNNLTNPGGNGEIVSIFPSCAGPLLIADISGVWQATGTSPNYTFSQVYVLSQRGRVLYQDSLCSLYLGQRQLNANPTVLRSTNGGTAFSEWDTGIGTGLEAHEFVENPADGMIYAVIEDGSTNNGWLYRTNK